MEVIEYEIKKILPLHLLYSYLVLLGFNRVTRTLLKNINAGNEVTKGNFTDWNRAGGRVVNGLLSVEQTSSISLPREIMVVREDTVPMFYMLRRAYQ